MMIRRFVLICCILGLAAGFYGRWSAADDAWRENPELGNLFKSEGLAGTFVLYDTRAKTCTGYNRMRAEKRYSPASTFKIPNSLIGLATGAVQSVDDVLPYRGDAQPFNPAWAKDMSLRQAITLSNVPIYQELARRIGLERMRDYLVRLDYGNQDAGTSVDQFWLSGPLMISAIEQIRFLAGLAQDQLPVEPALQKSVREMILLDQGSTWKLYGKTGWQNAPRKGVGWWVGWVEKEGRIYAFALNIDIQRESDAGQRIRLGKKCLKTLGILPET